MPSKPRSLMNPVRDVSWIGEAKLPKTRKDERGSNTFYSGFKLDDVEFHEGDSVLISASHSPQDYYIAKISNCFDNGCKKDSKRATVQWYSQADQVEKRHLKTFPSEYSQLDSTVEVVKDLHSYRNEIDVDTITAKCHITEVSATVDPSTVNRPATLLGHFFVCRFSYSSQKPYLVPLIQASPMETKPPISRSKKLSTPLKSKENVLEGTPSKRSRRLSKMAVLEELTNNISLNENTPRTPRQKRNNFGIETPSKENSSTSIPKRSIASLRTPSKIQKTPVKSTPTRSRSSKMPTVLEESPPKKAKLESHVVLEPLSPEILATLKLKDLKLQTPVKKTRRSKASTPLAKIPSRDTPIKPCSTQFEKARVKLHVSAVPDTLPCREEEFQQIFSFVEGKLLDSTGGCMYVSGLPGTGKTATVTEVIKLLQEAQKEDSLPSFQLLHLNAMKLTKPHQLWVQMWEGLTGEKATADHASKLLEKYLTTAPKRKCVVMLLDELDLLWTKKQDVMYNLFDWSSRVGNKLIVVAIANTMDLPERMMMSRVSSRLGLTRMTFQPYTHAQLQTIIKSRLTGTNTFDADAIQFVARKVAALSGDARRALDICRRATEIAEENCKCVSMDSVNMAINEMFASPIIAAIGRCSKSEKMLLQAIIAEFKRTGLEEAYFEKIIMHFESACRFEGYPVPSTSEMLFGLQSLSAQRIILAEHSRLDLNMRIRINVSMDDVIFAVG